MKRLFFLFFFLIPILINAQAVVPETHKQISIPKDNNQYRFSPIITYDSVAKVFRYNVPFQKSDTLKISTVLPAKKTDVFKTQIKQLTVTDTVFEFKFDYEFQVGYITLYDTLGGSPTVDSFYVERKDTLTPYASKTWTTSQMALIDMSTRSTYVMSTGSYGLPCIIAGDGYTKTFELYEKRPYIVRVWVTKYSCSSGRSKYVQISGKNL